MRFLIGFTVFHLQFVVTGSGGLIVPLALLGSFSLLFPEFRFAVFGVDTENAYGI